MISTFGHLGVSRISWRRELPPVLAVTGLAADYLSPAALWTILLPFGFAVLLLGLRKPAYAAVVFLLSSWVLVPTAAQAVSAVEDMQGQHPLYVVPDADQTTLDEAVADPDVPASVGFQVLPDRPRARHQPALGAARHDRHVRRAPQLAGDRTLARRGRSRRADARRQREAAVGELCAGAGVPRRAFDVGAGLVVSFSS